MLLVLCASVLEAVLHAAFGLLLARAAAPIDPLHFERLARRWPLGRCRGGAQLQPWPHCVKPRGASADFAGHGLRKGCATIQKCLMCRLRYTIFLIRYESFIYNALLPDFYTCIYSYMYM